jgi:hypothetical protein
MPKKNEMADLNRELAALSEQVMMSIGVQI